jgi:hypothetical protein
MQRRRHPAHCDTPLIFLGHPPGLQPILHPYVLADRRRATKEEVGPDTRLRERDNVADGRRPAQERDESIEAFVVLDASLKIGKDGVGDIPSAMPPCGGAPHCSACRRWPKRRCSSSDSCEMDRSTLGQEELERTNLEGLFHDERLHACIVYTHGPTSDLNAVEHEVVVLPADLFPHRRQSHSLLRQRDHAAAPSQSRVRAAPRRLLPSAR